MPFFSEALLPDQTGSWQLHEVCRDPRDKESGNGWSLGKLFR